MSEITYVSCLTPPGRAAIATLALCGPQSWEVVRQLFRTPGGKPLPELPAPGRYLFGRLGHDAADDVILAVKRTEPIPWLEFHTHGGREIVTYLLGLFTAQGAKQCSWPEFHAVVSGDRLQGFAAGALAEARTSRIAAILLDQYNGAFAAEINCILDALKRGNGNDARQRLGGLVARAPLGRRLTQPWRVALAGAPNVGKSSLINALAGFERSVVAPTPGTTRDAVTTHVAINGWPVELIDTAGFRADPEPLEEQGMFRAREAIASADLLLWLIDPISAVGPPNDLTSKARVVLNKVDLMQMSERTPGEILRVSALTGTGIANLADHIAQWLVPHPPSPGSAVPFTPALCDAVSEAHSLLDRERVQDAVHVLCELRKARQDPVASTLTT